MNRGAAKLAIIAIKFYKRFLSPLKGQTCRFYPTCSQYAIDALRKYGFIKGTLLFMKRIARCHPFNPGGYDPLK
ncbi:MAG: membrane protein insertion efficiency factor YidD [Ignavibacteriales bacterium]